MTTSDDADDAVIYCADGPLAGMHFLSTDWPDKAAAIFYRHTGEYAQYTWLDSRVEIWTYVGISTKTPSLRRLWSLPCVRQNPACYRSGVWPVP